ncbi:MAG: purine-nucleoside phosphorylase [Planctomycetes bacterium]|jgi:purine-nucleoside phosphorylase|nr:purine-nucleoside phosphorylase [Planctomycetota bacterium]
MEELRAKSQTAAEDLVQRSGRRPRVAMFLGTGHVEFAGRLENKQTFAVEDLLDFPSGVESQSLLIGTYEGMDVIVADAPLAPYLGVSGMELAFPVRVFRRMGAEVLVLTAAAASLRPGATPGDLGFVTDHLNFTNINPLIGSNDELLGPRFPDMNAPYDADLKQLARSVAEDVGFPCHDGVFCAIQGPSLPTRAEYRYLRSAGADFVGMSTVPEVIAAVHAGFRSVAILGITQRVDPMRPEPTDLENMVDAADLAAPRVSTVLAGVLEKLAQQ